MDIDRIDIDAIDVGPRRRSVDADRVSALAESIRAIGLQTPISVWANDDGTQVKLVAGAHRLAAAKQLGWQNIECILVNMDELERRRWEIAENLHRAELTALERDQHVAEWIRLTEESEKKQKVDLGQSDPKKPGRQKGGVRAAARELGIETKDAQRAVKVASLTDEAKETAREFGLDDNRSALLRAAAEPPEQQAQMLRGIAERKDLKKPEPDPTWDAEDEASYSDLLDAWQAATPAAKKQFLREHTRRAAA